MSWTVSPERSGVGWGGFSAYLRLLRKRGIDWTHVDRVSSMEVPGRWLNVWDDREDAEEFCSELNREARGVRWTVQEVPASAEPSRGSLMPVVVTMHRNSLGGEFSLDPHSITLVERRFPRARRVHSVAIVSESLQRPLHAEDTLWQHVAEMLTGLDAAGLDELGGFQVLAIGDEVVYDAVKEEASAVGAH